jgi:hypothetical protein
MLLNLQVADDVVHAGSSTSTGTGLVGGVAGEVFPILLQANDAREPEEQRITITSASALSGTFKLKFMGASTGPIPVTATDVVLKAALDALPTIGNVQVVRSAVGSALDRFVWNVKWAGSPPGASVCVSACAARWIVGARG